MLAGEVPAGDGLAHLAPGKPRPWWQRRNDPTVLDWQGGIPPPLSPHLEESVHDAIRFRPVRVGDAIHRPGGLGIETDPKHAHKLPGGRNWVGPDDYRSHVHGWGSLRAQAHLGIDITRDLGDTYAGDRKRVAALLSTDSRTKNLGSCVYFCGQKRLAECDGELGTYHAQCRRPLCPFCMRTRAHQLAARFHAFGRERIAGGKRLMLLTTTQKKDPNETLAQAHARMCDSWGVMVKENTSLAREFRKVCAGGVRNIESTYTPPDEPNPGWHVHIHAIVELQPGVTAQQFRDTHYFLWRAASPESGVMAQHAAIIQPDNSGAFAEACKYPLKPHKIPDHLLIEATVALKGKRMCQGWGTWYKAQPEGKALIAAESPRPPMRVCLLGIGILLDDSPIPIVCKGPDGETTVKHYPVKDFRKAIWRDPRTFAQRDRDDAADTPRREPDTRRIPFWVRLEARHAWIRQRNDATRSPPHTRAPAGPSAEQLGLSIDTPSPACSAPGTGDRLPDRPGGNHAYIP